MCQLQIMEKMLFWQVDPKVFIAPFSKQEQKLKQKFLKILDYIEQYKKLMSEN